MTETAETPSDETKEVSETLQLEPLKLVDGEVPPEFRKKFWTEIIPALGLAEMDLAAGSLASELAIIAIRLDSILREKKGDASDAQNTVNESVIRFNRNLKDYLLVFHRDKKARAEISEAL